MVKAKRKQQQKLKMSTRMQKTSRRMDALAKQLGKWNPQATIRKFRDSNLIGNLMEDSGQSAREVFRMSRNKTCPLLFE